MCVPIDEKNRNYQELKEEIKKGACDVQEPVISQVTKAYTEKGVLSGYLWDCGFVPCDDSNRVYNLIMEAIHADQCVVNEPAAHIVDEAEKVEAIIFCIFFDQPWLGVDSVFPTKVAYSASHASASREYSVQLINLPTGQAQDKFYLLCNLFGINQIPPISNMPLQAGVLSVEIPANYLLPLFRNEVKRLGELGQTFLPDVIEQHLLEKGRNIGNGPTIHWLISYAKTYLEGLIQDIGNRVIEAFSREYGTKPMGYIDRWKIYEETIVINRLRNQAHVLGSFGLQAKQPIPVDTWTMNSSSLKQLFRPEETVSNIYLDTMTKVSMLLKTGLHMEALCLVNAVLEVKYEYLLCKWALLGSDAEMAAYIKNQSGYWTHLEIMKKIVQMTPESWDVGEKSNYLAILENAEEIYKIRNDYIHALKLPGGGIFLNTIQVREIEKLLNTFCNSWTLFRGHYYEHITEEGREAISKLRHEYIKKII